jgi:hypothetical protein
LPLTLSHVCRRWRAILLSPDYPSIWARIYSTPRSIIDLYLERSGNAELDLHLTRVNKDLIDTVIRPNCGRMRQLHVFFQSISSGIQIPDLDFVAPRLKSLAITSPNSHLGPLYYPILSSELLPNLSKLNLRSLPLPPNTEFTALTHLCLLNCWGSDQDLFRLLQANPNLEELILFGGINSRWKSNKILDGPLSVPLPHLRWIYLHNHVSIFHRLRLPPNCALRIVTPTEDLAPLSFPILKFHLIRFFAALGEFGFAQYVTTSETLSGWLPRAVADSNIFGSVHELWLDIVLAVNWVVVFRHLPLLRTLHLGYNAPAVPVLVALTPGPQGPVLCPNLCELYISRAALFPGQLLELVKARKERAAALGKLQLYADRAWEGTDADADELRLWVGEFAFGCRGPWEAFGMDIPEKFTGSRRASWISRGFI